MILQRRQRLCLDLILELEIVMDTFGAETEETLQKRWNIVMKTDENSMLLYLMPCVRTHFY